MSNVLWRWADPSGKQRRVKLDELRSALAGGLVAPNTPVWKPGWKAWRPAQEVPELQGGETPPPANGDGVPDIPPPPLAVLAVQHDFEAEAERMSNVPEEEPPPPPSYVPLPAKGGSVPTMIGGSGVVVTAPGKSIPPPPAKASAIPTQIGLPPPPEIKALAEQRAAAKDDGIEELSAADLFEEVPSMPSTSAAEASGIDGEIPRRDARWLLQQLKADIAEIRAKRPPKNKGLVVVAGLVSLCVVILFLAIMSSILGAIFGSKDDAVASSSASASASSSEPPSVATTSETTPATAPSPEEPKPAAAAAAPRALGGCTTTGDPKLVSARAVITGGLEATVTQNGLAIGFATSAREGVAQWFESNTVSRVRGNADVRHVTPMILGGKAIAMLDFDRRGDRLQMRRVVPSGSLFDVGVADNAIMWAPHGTSSVAKLFDLEGEGPVEALRAVPLDGQKGVALAFRRGGSVYVGAAVGDAVLEPKSGLARITGSGQVGSPAVATSGDALMVAFADRAPDQEEWQVRFARTTLGQAPGESVVLALPEGGPGGQAMSPAIASLGGGAFLLAWTEGPVANHQVRAIAMDSDGRAAGSALTISAPGVNAGQPQAAVGPDGKGVVAFLVAKGKSYEVHATPISCASK